ncbi:ABC transporter ATP-binding protein [Bacillus sp. 1P06AnD]|uniref:ABC transporter ATP-binding protein n=1 Tax=Bacillus sp. 1P06AnD TaxID=3132208 RepID=UPI0039A3A794
MDDNVICVQNLTKLYDGNKGIFQVDFSVAKGRVFGFVGPNGAGKTTTLRHLMGYISPDEGACTISGLDCWKNACDIQRVVGYLPGEIVLMQTMTGLEFLEFMADMRGMKDREKMNRLIDFFELNPHGKIKRMSKGMKQKIGLVCAFMHDPSILILDEPTSGLDPLMQNKFVELILQEKKQGKTILMSSHHFEEIERTCDEVAMIKNGRIVAIENIEFLKRNMIKTFIVTFQTPSDAGLFVKRWSRAELCADGYRVESAVKGNLNDFIELLAEFQIINLDIKMDSLEEVFMQYYGGAVHD